MFIDETFGAALIGLVCGAILYGVTILQTFLYYRNYPKDHMVLKLLVFLLWVLDTLHLLFCTTTIYSHLVTHFGDETALGKTTWSMNLQTDCNGLIGMLVEFFFARRVWLLSRNRILTGLILVLACLHFGLGIVFTVDMFRLVEFSKFNQLIWVTCTGLGSAAAADALIAGSLCWYLWRRRTGFPRTDSLITTLMVYSLDTGLATSILATAAVIAFATMPTNFIWLAFFWVLGKCYVNSLLATLNSRSALRAAGTHATHETPVFQLSPFQLTPGGQGQAIQSTGPIAITVETTTVAKRDLVESSRSSITNGSKV